MSFPRNLIKEGLYTKGDEWTVDGKKPYVGLYHKLPNGQIFTQPFPDPSTSLPLTRWVSPTIATGIYDNLNRKPEINGIRKFTEPRPFICIPTESDYQKHFVKRFFVQNQQNLQSIIEVDEKQYNTLPSLMSGINQYLFKGATLDWAIIKLSTEDTEERKKIIKNIYQKNFETVKNVSLQLKGFDKFIRYYTQFTF